MKVIAIFALVAMAAGAPVITLNLDESAKHLQTKHAGGYGVGCNRDAKYCRAVRSNPSESRYIHSCLAGKAADCKLPVAVAYDHHEHGITEKVTYQISLVNDNGNPESGVTCKGKVDSHGKVSSDCVDRNKRSEWVTKYDVCDESGNCADSVLFAIVLNDIEAPTIVALHIPDYEACTGNKDSPIAKATDNCDMSGRCHRRSAVGVRTVPRHVVTDKPGRFSGTWSATDNADMFGARGANNVALKAFTYTVKDTIKPTCRHNGNKVIECEKAQYFDLINEYKPSCTDACKVVGAAVTSISRRYARFPARSTTHFSFTQKDSNGLTGTVAATIKVVDTTPPVLQISDGGHSHRTFNHMGWENKIVCTAANRKICAKYNKGECAHSHERCRIPFSYEVSREMGFDWANEKRIVNRLGDKKEAKKVQEMMKAGTGYKCKDTCGSTKVALSIHVNQARKRDGIACNEASLNSKNKVAKYLTNQPWTFVIKYTCTDQVGLMATKCRTITNTPGKYKKAIKVYVSVPDDIETIDIANSIEGFFYEPEYRKLNVVGSLCKNPATDPCGYRRKPRRDDVFAKKGTVVESRRLGGGTAMRQDTFAIAASRKNLRKIYHALTTCEFSEYVAKKLELECAKLSDADEVVCVRVDDVAVDEDAGAPIIVIPDMPDNANGKNDKDTDMDLGTEMIIEAFSNWAGAINPDLKESTKAYCIDTRCALENPLDCPGRLPLKTSVEQVIDGASCNSDGDTKDPDAPAITTLITKPGVDVKTIGNYKINYSCSLTAEGITLEAMDKKRDILVVDTTKPTCDVKVKSVTREASFPFSIDTPVCKDTYWGSKGKQPATVTLGSFDVEKVSGPKGYVLTYTATDNSGNTAVFKKSTVIVVDTLKPVIELSYGAKKFHRSDALDKGVNAQKNPVHKPL